MTGIKWMLFACSLLLLRAQTVVKEVTGSVKFKAAGAKALSADTTKTAAIKAELVKFLGIPVDWLTTSFVAVDSDANIEVTYKILVPKDNTNAALSAEKLMEKMIFGPSEASAKNLADAVAKAISDNTVAVALNSAPTIVEKKAQRLMGSLKFKVANPNDVKNNVLQTEAIKTILATWLGVKEEWMKLTFSVVTDGAKSKSNTRRLADLLEIAYQIIVPADNTDPDLSADKLKENLTFKTTDETANGLVSLVALAMFDTTASLASVSAPTVTEASDFSTSTAAMATFGSASISMIGIAVVAISF